MSIQRRLLWGLLAGLAALSAISAWFLYSYMQTVLTRSFDAALAAKAHAVASLVKQQPDGRVEVDFSADAMPEFTPGATAEYFQIWGDDGSIAERSPSLGEGNLPRDVAGADGPVFVDLALPDGRPGRALALRVIPLSDVDDAEPAGTSQAATQRPAGTPVRVVVAQGRADLDRILATLRSALLLAGILLVAGTIAIVTATVRRGLRPLRQVAEQAAAIGVRSLDVRFSTADMPSELRPICARLNESLAQLEQAFQRQRRFTADVAHELRTPIAELRSLADVALTSRPAPETSYTYFQDAQDLARQMEAIVTTLLALARCQSGSMSVLRQPVDLVEVIEEAWQRYQPEAARRGLAVDFQVPASVMLESDRSLLVAMVANLFSNAVQYTPRGGAVRFEAQSRGSGIELVMANDTDGLTQEDIPHLFEPFWRKDPARADGSHCGLGLTLVAAYAALLGGKIEASMPEAHSLRLTLWLGPVTQPCCHRQSLGTGGFFAERI